jgi:hypothetical protein
MIFNKFGPLSLCNKLKALSFQLLALSLFSCNKSANINATGVDGNPYDTTISRISDMNIFLAQDTSMSIHGNAAFQQGSHYSVFFFDTLDSRSITLIILQDNPPVRYDTLTTIRFMNFSPGSSIGLKLI